MCSSYTGNQSHFSFLPCSAANCEAERQTGDAVPSVPGGGQRLARRGFLHGLPLLRSPRDQAAANLTRSSRLGSVSPTGRVQTSKGQSH